MMSRPAPGRMPGGLRATLLRASVAGLLVLPAACGAPPPPPVPPTVAQLTLSTTADANPTDAGQGAPLVLRVYQLSSPAAFEKAEFYRLYNQDTATLGADLIKKDEYLLAPGTSRTITLNPAEPVRAIGVFGGYRAFQKATWRGTADIPPHKTTAVTVTAGAAGITVTAKPAP